MRTLFLFLSFVVMPAISQAYSYIDNRGLFPIGEVEAFMANTGVALSGSTGAVYYNPAGLASLSRPHLSISANTYMSTTSEAKPLETIDGTEINFKTGGTQAIPSAFVSTGHLMAGSTDLHWAFSILIPHALKVQDSKYFSSPHYPNIALSRTNAFQTLMVGPSVAVSGAYDVGAGCFYTMYSTTQSYLFTANTNGSTKALVSNEYLDASVNGVSCNFGVQTQIAPALRLGAVVRTPFVRLSNSATAMMFVQRPSDGAGALQGPIGVDADYAMPTDLSFGLEAHLLPALRAYIDASYQFGSTVKTGELNAPAQESKGVARGSVGLAFAANESLDVFGGVQYNPSSVRAAAGTVNEDFIEATAGARWSMTNSNIGLGLMYAHSSGSFQSMSYDDQLNTLGQRASSAETSALGVLLSSGYMF